MRREDTTNRVVGNGEVHCIRPQKRKPGTSLSELSQRRFTLI